MSRSAIVGAPIIRLPDPHRQSPPIIPPPAPAARRAGVCRWLIRSAFVPKMLGVLGFVGYIGLVAAMTASAFGSETASMALLLPGAAFEVIFGLILVGGGWKIGMRRLSR